MPPASPGDDAAGPDPPIDTVFREVTGRVVDATTRAEVEQVLCRGLADVFRFAWVGVPRGADDELRPSEWAGRGEHYLQAVTVTADTSEQGDGPSGRAYCRGTPQVAADLQSDPRFGPWREAASDHGFRSAAAIPISHRETVYGVLNLYAAEAGAFDAETVETLSELGRVAGYACSAVENRRLLYTDSVVELEFHNTDDASIFTVASVELDCRLGLEGVVPASEGTYLFYVGVEGTAPSTFCAFAERYDPIRESRVLADEGEASLVLLEVAGGSNVLTLIETGARVQSATAEDGESTLVAEVAPETEVGSVVDAVRRVFPGSRLVGKREVERPVQTDWAFREDVRSSLTDRQVAVLEAALRGGYFARPRDVTGQELADSFDITASTFHHHLQTGLRKVVAAVFDESGEH
jgi:putative methionine-R-sulfoxide reductase with GAF domain